MKSAFIVAYGILLSFSVSCGFNSTEDSTQSEVSNTEQILSITINKGTWLKNSDKVASSSELSEDKICYIPANSTLTLATKLDANSYVGNHLKISLKEALPLSVKPASEYKDIEKYDNLTKQCSFTSGIVFIDHVDQKPLEAIKPKLAGLGEGNVKMHNGLSNNCFKFLDRQGNPGEWGKVMIEAMDSHGDVFYDHQKYPALKQVVNQCPVFGRTSNKIIKQHVWLWAMAGLSQAEAGCSANNNNGNATNGTAYGLFQLEGNGRWRGGACNTSQSMNNPHANIRCAMQIMASHITGKIVGTNQKFPVASITGRQSYWEPVRNNKVSNWLSKNPSCDSYLALVNY